MPLPPPLLAKLTHRAYYMGPRPWLSACSAHLTFVTTEALVADVIEGALRKSRMRDPIRLDLTNVPDVYPIRVPVLIDRRAAADQTGSRARLRAGAGDPGRQRAGPRHRGRVPINCF